MCVAVAVQGGRRCAAAQLTGGGAVCVCVGVQAEVRELKRKLGELEHHSGSARTDAATYARQAEALAREVQALKQVRWARRRPACPPPDSCCRGGPTHTVHACQPGR